MEHSDINREIILQVLEIHYLALLQELKLKKEDFPPPRLERGYQYLRPEYYRAKGMYASVGYRPVITWLPEGTIMGVRGHVTPDRKRVIIGGHFGFYGIQGVRTFNFVTGEYQ